MSLAFVLERQEFMALNGGPHFTFTDGISLLQMTKIDIAGLRRAYEQE